MSCCKGLVLLVLVERPFYICKMPDVPTKIATGLEALFAKEGFTEPSVDRLREAADVSLRTLYKYCPSREDMILAALQHRHERYLDQVFTDLPDEPDHAVAETFDRAGRWMQGNGFTGCLFHSAVAAHPNSAPLRDMHREHKAETEAALARVAGCTDLGRALLLVHEGLSQTWLLNGNEAMKTAKSIAQTLTARRTER